MTYPQPNTAVTSSGQQQLVRLNTLVNGPGEIYEMDSSVKAIAFGPDSDFNNILLTYFDPNIPATQLGSIRVSGQYPFGGGVIPRIDQTYPSSGRRGRLFVSVADNYATGYLPQLPSAYNVAKDTISFVIPTLDLIGYYTAPPTLPSKRSDKSFLYQSHSAAAGVGGVFWRVFPTFGRKYVYVNLFNNSGAGIAAEIRGVNFSTVNNSIPTNAGPRDDQETVISASGVLASGASLSKVVTMSATGVFDAIAISIGNSVGGPTIINDAPLRVVVTDDPV